MGQGGGEATGSDSDTPLGASTGKETCQRSHSPTGNEVLTSLKQALVVRSVFSVSEVEYFVCLSLACICLVLLPCIGGTGICKPPFQPSRTTLATLIIDYQCTNEL